MGEFSFFDFPTVIGLVFGIGVVVACALGYITAQTWKLRDMLREVAEEVGAQGKQAATNVTFADTQPSLPDVGQCLVSIGKTLDMLKIVTNDNARYANQALITHNKASGDYEQLSKDIGRLFVELGEIRKSIWTIQRVQSDEKRAGNGVVSIESLAERVGLLVNKVVEVRNEVDMANQRLTLLAETLLPPMPAILPEPEQHVIIKQTKPDVIADSFTMETPKERRGRQRKEGGQLL